MRSLRQNLGLKIGAVAVAAFFWVLSHQDMQKREIREFDQSVNVTGLDEGMYLVSPLPHVKMTLAGPKALVDSVDQKQINAYVNVERQGPGLHKRLVQYERAALPSGITVAVDPREITFELDRTTVAELTVQVVRSSEPPVGVELDTMTPSPVKAAVSGVSTQVAKVQFLQAAVDVAKLGDLTPGEHPIGQYPVRPLDADGRPVVNVTVMPTMVDVTLTVSRAAVARTVLVSPRITGRLPGAYEIRDIVVDPREITITGSPTAVAAVTTVRTEAIDVSNLRDRLDRIIALTPIDGVSYGGRRKVRVVIKVKERGVSSDGGTP